MITWNSKKLVASTARPGVEFVVARMTFGRRLDLMRRIRDLAARVEYFEAGQDKNSAIEASVAAAEMDCLYLIWGLDEVRGLELDESPATVKTLIDCGPEELIIEALAAVKAECGLSENERKN